MGLLQVGMASDTKGLLVKQRTALLNKLVSLASTGRPEHEAAIYRKEAGGILKEFLLTDRALSSIALVKTEEFAEEQRPIEAVLAFLDKHGAPASKQEIIDGVVVGGYRSGDPQVRIVLLKSINIHLTGTGKNRKLIREVNGLVGRWDWNDSLFHQE